MITKVFVVDDHYMVIEGIKALLENEAGIEWMGHATNAASCLHFLQRNTPDIILMDINLPDKSGIDLCKEVTNLYPGIFVIGLSTFNQYSFISKMIDNGAKGYVLKNATRQELQEAIFTVSKHKKYFSNEVTRVMTQLQENAPLLTRREREVLNLIAEGMTNNEITEKLFISINTVDTHRKNLMIKLKAKNTAELIKHALQHNLIDYSEN
ncbi:response regulator transcription factor [Pedobacter aquatilis]|uniref:response regulator transcription factor n=1 Tax=Pedobacter aquatilis TaxID=351343 RepID=UPI00292E1C89|nr:response regulator transcription factor [Pedobacter aquatilis]